MPVYSPSDRVGQPFVKVDPAKIVGVVRTSEPNDEGAFAPLDDVTKLSVTTWLSSSSLRWKLAVC